MIASESHNVVWQSSRAAFRVWRQRSSKRPARKVGRCDCSLHSGTLGIDGAKTNSPLQVFHCATSGWPRKHLIQPLKCQAIARLEFNALSAVHQRYCAFKICKQVSDSDTAARKCNSIVLAATHGPHARRRGTSDDPSSAQPFILRRRSTMRPSHRRRQNGSSSIALRNRAQRLARWPPCRIDESSPSPAGNSHRRRDSRSACAWPARSRPAQAWARSRPRPRNVISSCRSKMSVELAVKAVGPKMRAGRRRRSAGR